MRDARRFPALAGAVEVDLRHAEIAAALGEQFPHELVVRLVLFDRRADPTVIGLRRQRPKLDGKLGLDTQHVAPLHRPVVGELFPLQQTVDQMPSACWGCGRPEIAAPCRPWAPCRSHRDRRVAQIPGPSTGSPVECPTVSNWRKPARRSCPEEPDRPHFEGARGRRSRPGTGQRQSTRDVK